MGEQARRRSRSREQILAGEKRCIYCDFSDKSNMHLEHMPPIQMFKGNIRLNGMEFAGCRACNNGTRAADTVASFVARMKMSVEKGDWEIEEARTRIKLVRLQAPGVLEEIFPAVGSRIEWYRDKNGLIKPLRTVQIKGPLTHKYLNTFSAKLGMALYREHVKAPLPLDGYVFSRWFTNGGISQDLVDSITSIMPDYETLKQGRKDMYGQFSYRFNTDERSIVAAMSKFHVGLYVMTVATTIEKVIDLFRSKLMVGISDAITRPGDLKMMLPQKADLALRAAAAGDGIPG